MADEIICNCMQVTRETIEKAIREKGLTSVEMVQEVTEAGTGCGGCIEDIEAILKQING
jgi:NAD(P)H-nitrite reductase large subunit